MKIIFWISAVSLVLALSCSSSKINSNHDLHGAWVSRFDQTLYLESSAPVYYQFTFDNDSFFVEIGVLSDDIDLSYRPFRSKGIFKITEDYLSLTGVAKAEGSTNYNLDYKETFTYDYSTNYLSLYSLNRWNLTYYELIRRSPITK